VAVQMDGAVVALHQVCASVRPRRCRLAPEIRGRKSGRACLPNAGPLSMTSPQRSLPALHGQRDLARRPVRSTMRPGLPAPGRRCGDVEHGLDQLLRIALQFRQADVIVAADSRRGYSACSRLRTRSSTSWMFTVCTTGAWRGQQTVEQALQAVGS